MLNVALRTVAVLFTGLVAGILFGDWLGAARVRPALSAECFVHFQQGLHSQYVWLMPPLLIISALAGAVVAWRLWHADRVSALYFGAAALLVVTIIVLVRSVNVPINEALMTWDPANPPADVRQIWARWEQAHSIRTPLAVLAFLLQCLAPGAPRTQPTAA